MKIAICIRGFVGSMLKNCLDSNFNTDKRCLIFGHRHFNEFILQPNQHHEIDVYIHSWSCDLKKAIIETYKPKDYLIEEPITFSKNPRFNANYSFWYSTMKSVDLVKNDYDLCMISRFDIGFVKPLIFDEYNKSTFYVAEWITSSEPNKYMDMVFISNLFLMKQFSKLYEYLPEYEKHFKKLSKMSNHLLCGYHINKFNIGPIVKSFPYKQDYFLIRELYDKTSRV